MYVKPRTDVNCAQVRFGAFWAKFREEFMLKHFGRGALASVLLCAQASASSHEPKTVPALSGSYLYTASEFCPSGDGTLHQLSGSIAFDPATGKAKGDFFIVNGSAPEILHIRSTQTYSNTADLLTLGPSSYHVTYGGVADGIATSANFVGLVQDSGVTCGYQGEITLR